MTRPGYGPAPVLPGHQVAVELHGPGVVRKGPGHNKCQLDYVESHEEVCIPTFKTDCDKEDVPGGVVIKHHDQCDDVVKPSALNIMILMTWKFVHTQSPCLL